jgi:ribosomal protein L24
MSEAREIASWNQIEHQGSIVLAEGVEKRIQDVKEKKNKGNYISIHSLHKYSNIDILKILKYI